MGFAVRVTTGTMDMCMYALQHMYVCTVERRVAIELLSHGQVLQDANDRKKCVVTVGVELANCGLLVSRYMSEIIYQ